MQHVEENKSGQEVRGMIGAGCVFELGGRSIMLKRQSQRKA